MFEQYPDILTPREVRKALRISNAEAYNIIKSGKLKHFTVGRSIKIPKYALLDFLAKMCDNNNKELGLAR